MKKHWGGIYGLIILLLGLAGLTWGQAVKNPYPIPWSMHSTDGTFAANSDSKHPTEKATKTYVGTVASGYVPTSRTVNGKALTGNITLGLASADFANQGTTATVLHGNASGNPGFSAVSLTADVTGVLPPANGGGPQGTTVTNSGTVNLTTASSRQTHVATGTVTYVLPTGDLSALISASLPPLRMGMIVKSAANTVTIDPAANNFIAGGGAGKTMTDSVAGETYATITLQLISSAASVNTWVIVSAHGTWVMTP